MRISIFGHPCRLYALLLLAGKGGLLCRAAEAPEAPRSPVNQVFQFMRSDSCSAWADGSTNQATAYLWIPENCPRLRGLLILCANVPEHRLVGHSAIRAACAANSLGIVWCVPSFMNFRKDTAKSTDNARDHKTSAAFLQRLLDGLAKDSGYDEVATVPWLPMGESGHLLMVDALVEQCPDRCIAGVWIKNNHLPPKNRLVPALVAYGTAQEWSQDKTDIRANWNTIGKAYEGVLEQRKKNPNWPLSYIIDGGSGHFDCSERLAQYFARYIDLVAKARLAPGGTLKPVSLEQGFLADMPVPGHENHPAVAFATTAPDERGVPWFFDRASAEEAQAFARINWQAATQLPGFADAREKVMPFNFDGICSLEPETEADGITFTIRGVMLDRLPENFVNAGTKLEKTEGVPALEWLCGPVAPLGGGKFQIALDRSWPGSACYIAARQSGNGRIRDSVQPCGVKLKKNDRGQAQTIAFDPIPDVKAGTAVLPLSAKSSAGLPVRFFVVAGPAVVQEGKLVFTKVPPRAKFPMSVTVAGWQWGRATEPEVKTAEIVKQTFHLTAPGVN